MNSKDDRILFSPKTGKGNFSLSFSLSEEEKKLFPLLVSLEDFSLRGRVLSSKDTYALTLSCKGRAKRKDSHDFSLVTIPFSDEIELTLSPDKEISDIERDKEGNYDLRGSILTLLRNAIPKNYSKTRLTKIVHKDYVLISEEEYEKEKHSSGNSPFADLDLLREEKK